MADVTTEKKRPKKANGVAHTKQNGKVELQTPEGGRIRLKLRDVVVNRAWNSRKETYGRPKEDKDASRVWPDEALDASVKERVEQGMRPLLEEPEIRRLPDGRWSLVYGFRRFEALLRVFGPDFETEFLVMPSTGNEKEDDKNARIENLVENIQRVDLRPWEQADAFFYLSTEHEMTAKDIATRTGVSPSHAANLIRLRKKLAPVLWEEYRQKGEFMRMDHLLKVCARPKEDQQELYNKLVEGKSIDENEEVEEVTPTRKRGKVRTYNSWRNQCRKLIAGGELGERRRLRVEGMLFAINCVLGEEEWQNPAVREKGEA